MKRIIALTLVCAFLFLVASCGRETGQKTVAPETGESVERVTKSETVTEPTATASPEETVTTAEEPEPEKAVTPAVPSSTAPQVTEPATPVRIASREPNEDELKTLELINQRRAEAGVPALVFDYD